MKRSCYDGLADGAGPSEKWVRLPSRTGERIHGLSRPFIYNLIAEGLIKTASLKKPGKLTGVRVIWLPSLLDYIEKHSVQVTKEEK